MADYTFSDHMEPLKKHRDNLLFFKNAVRGNHHNDHRCFVGITNTNPDSLDQIVAEHVGHQSRVRNVVTIGHAHHHIVASWRTVPVMPIQSTRVLLNPFARTDKKTQERLLANKKSVLDGSLKNKILNGTCLWSR